MTPNARLRQGNKINQVRFIYAIKQYITYIKIFRELSICLDEIIQSVILKAVKQSTKN